MITKELWKFATDAERSAFERFQDSMGLGRRTRRLRARLQARADAAAG